MVAGAQQGREQGCQCAHTGRKRKTRDTIFHLVDFFFKRIACGRALSGVGVAGFTLKYCRELTGIAKRILRRGMDGLVHSAVLDRSLTVTMQNCGGKAVLRGFFSRLTHRSFILHKNAYFNPVAGEPFHRGISQSPR